MIFSGIDGCKAGWLNFEIDEAGKWRSYLADTFQLCVEKVVLISALWICPWGVAAMKPAVNATGL